MAIHKQNVFFLRLFLGNLLSAKNKKSMNTTKPTKCPVRPAMTQSTLGKPTSLPASIKVPYWGHCINALPWKVSFTTRLFADDSLLYRMIRSSKVQDDLDRLQQWENVWQMSFNPTKCFVIRITKKRNPIKANYSIHNQDLHVEFVKNGKYLGVALSDNLSWNTHVDDTTKKANNTLAFLRRNLARCPRDIKAHCCISLERSVMAYASTAWDPYTNRNFQQI